MKKVLIITNHRLDRSPGQRFRFEQYLDFLNKNGFHCDVSYLLSEKDDKYFYSKGNGFRKLLILLKSFFKRQRDIKLSKNYDIVFVFREAFFTGTTFFEKKLSKKAKLIFDFDDSIWLPNVSDANKKLRWLKNYSKTETIINISDIVIAGNQFLLNYSLKFNQNVVLIPTTVDTHQFQRKENIESSKICIGWSGSSTTVKHFELLIPILIKVKNLFKDRVYIKLIGDENYVNNLLELKGVKWSSKNEVEELLEFDVGIMPLPNNDWTKGKCGLKGLTYMALETPTIMSPVGVNTEIIQDGENGFLADGDDEWVDKISRLIESAELRKKLGKAGRKTVIEKYSVEANKEKYLDVFNSLFA